MKVVSSLLVALFMFTGCFTRPIPIFPSMAKIEPVHLKWEDMNCHGRNVHTFSSIEWQKIQETLINGRINNNMCAEVVNRYNSTKERDNDWF